jgi:hypothetical protein
MAIERKAWVGAEGTKRHLNSSIAFFNQCLKLPHLEEENCSPNLLAFNQLNEIKIYFPLFLTAQFMEL